MFSLLPLLPLFFPFPVSSFRLLPVALYLLTFLRGPFVFGVRGLSVSLVPPSLFNIFIIFSLPFFVFLFYFLPS